MAADKSAKQHTAQVKTILGSNENISCLWSKAHLRKFTDTCAAEKQLHPGTIKSYLASVKHLYAFLLADGNFISDNDKVGINYMSGCLTRWIRAYRKESAKRGLDKMDDDFGRLITPEQIYVFEKSSVAMAAIKLIGAVLESDLPQSVVT